MNWSTVRDAAACHKPAIGTSVGYGSKIDEIIYEQCDDFTPVELLRLAFAALDQAGATVIEQDHVIRVLRDRGGR